MPWFAPKRIAVAGGLIVAVVTIAAGLHWSKAPAKVPTAEVQRSDFVDYVEIRGQIKALRSETITAPASAGDLQIMKLAPNGAQVKKGDVLVEFDASNLKQKYAQDRSALRAAEADIEKTRAGSRLKEEQDVTDAMKAKFAIQSAKMDASKEEILSPIEGAKARIKVSDAERKHEEAQVKLEANRAAGSADAASKGSKRDEAQFAVKQDEVSLASLTIRAPLDGVVAVQGNWRSAGPMSATQPFKAGDRAWAGAALIELPDPSSLRVIGRVEEADRGRVALSQEATVRLDAIADKTFTGKVDEISATASPDFQGGWPFPRNFTIGVSVKETDSRLSPGMGAVTRVVVDRVPNAIVIPSSAIFRKGGQSVVYLLRGSRFEETPVDVQRRSGESALLAKGVKAGDKIALKDPTVE
jgi:HlyD family secretion protein